MERESVRMTEAYQKVRCGDCAFFVRDGKCRYLQSEEGISPNRRFEEAPFWVWSDCYSDKEQVRSNVESCCAVFKAREIQP
jgi:hypothetical protein